jgi:threonine dehydrogenase-like Zn-dependent dehydrogenase
VAVTAAAEGPQIIDGADLGKGDLIISRYRGRCPVSVRRAINLMVSGRVNIKPLITHRFKIEEAESAFQMLQRREVMKAQIVP